MAGSTNVQQATEKTACEVKEELASVDSQQHKMGGGLGSLAALSPLVIDFLKGLGEAELQAAVAYVGTRFNVNFLGTEAGAPR